jgi:hypothetical protein
MNEIVQAIASIFYPDTDTLAIICTTLWENISYYFLTILLG